MANTFTPKYYRFRLTSKTAMLMHADDVEKADLLKDWRKDPANKAMSTPGDDRSPPWSWKVYLYVGFIDGIQQVVCPCENIMSALKYAGSQITLKGAKTFKKLSQSGIMIMEEFCNLEVGLGTAENAPIVDGEYCKHSQMMPNDGESYDQLAVRHCAELGIKPGDKHPGYGLRPILADDLNNIPPMMKFRDQVNACRKLGFNLYVKRAPVGASKHVRVRPRYEAWTVTGTFKVTQEAIDDKVIKQMLEIAGEQSGLCDWRPSAPKSPGPYGQFNVELTEVAKP